MRQIGRALAVRLLHCAVLAGLLGSCVVGQEQQEVIRLWPGIAPGSETWAQKEIRFVDPQFGGETIRNVVEPTLTVFLPRTSTANRTAVVVCPGGAFQALSWDNEGTAVASWLNGQGVTAFVLKYRLANTGETDAEFRRIWGNILKDLRADSAQAVAALAPQAAVAAADGRRAIQIIRQNASKWGIASDRIGILGFSAGAAIALDVGTQHDDLTKPNFVGSIYGPSLRSSHVPADAPPIFIACASDDPILPVGGNLELYSAWKSGGHLAEIHVYTKGGHGFGMRKQGLPIDSWVDQFHLWLKDQGF